MKTLHFRYLYNFFGTIPMIPYDLCAHTNQCSHVNRSSMCGVVDQTDKMPLAS